MTWQTDMLAFALGDCLLVLETLEPASPTRLLYSALKLGLRKLSLRLIVLAVRL